MKFSKKLYTLILTAIMVLSLTVSAFASTGDDIGAALEKAGIPVDQTGKVIEYLQKVNITKDQLNDAIAKIDSAVSKLNGQTDLTKLSGQTKKDIQADIVAAAAAIGLKADFSSKNSNGSTVIVFTDSNGNKIVSGDSSNIALVKSFDASAIKTAIASAQNFSNSADKATFAAVNGAPMKKTSTNYGTLMGIAVLMLVGGGCVMLFNKKAVKNN